MIRIKTRGLPIEKRLLAILMAIPYGALADKIGRKKILLLAIIGILLDECWIRLVCMFTSESLRRSTMTDPRRLVSIHSPITHRMARRPLASHWSRPRNVVLYHPRAGG